MADMQVKMITYRWALSRPSAAAIEEVSSGSEWCGKRADAG